MSLYDKNVVKATVRNLRRRSTPCEDTLWDELRNRKVNGKKFQRQFPLQFEYLGCKRFFVADFYCHETKLVIEVDGPVHERQCDYDEMRTAVLKTLGVRIVRFKNEEIDDNLEAVLKEISYYL